jgi:hypothetical protein
MMTDPVSDEDGANMIIAVDETHGEVTTYDDAMALWLWMDSGYRKNLVSCYDLHFTPETLH